MGKIQNSANWRLNLCVELEYCICCDFVNLQSCLEQMKYLVDHPFFEGQDLLKLSVWLRTLTKRQFLFRKKPSQIFGKNTSECCPLFLEGLKILVKSSPHHPLSTFFTTCPKQTSPKNLNNRISAFLSILGGAFKYFWNFHPDPCGNDPIWWTYYSNGLVQPATSIWVEKISKSITNSPKNNLEIAR